MDPERLNDAVAWVGSRRARGMPGAQLVVLLRGSVVLDRAFGFCGRKDREPVTPSSLFLIYSAGKPFVALLAHLLAERGAVALDDPVAGYWPAFGRHGKERVTLRHLLQQRAGIPLDNAIAMLSTLPSWTLSIRRLEKLRPSYPPGSVPAYHAFTAGFAIGEVVRLVTGKNVEDFQREVFFEPLGLGDTHLGLPTAQWYRTRQARRHVVTASRELRDPLHT